MASLSNGVIREVASTPTKARKAGIAALVGTVLEWYDFIIYGTAAAIVLNKIFFPASDPAVGTLAVFATYAVGFLARLLGCLPSYAEIGLWAPILLVVLRLIQGFGAGGEYAGAVVLSVEHAQKGRRGAA